MNEDRALFAWIAIGIGIGTALGAATGNFPLSIVMGATLGMIIIGLVSGRRKAGF